MFIVIICGGIVDIAPKTGGLCSIKNNLLNLYTSDQILEYSNTEFLDLFDDSRVVDIESIFKTTKYSLLDRQILVQHNKLRLSYSGRILPTGFNSTNLRKEDKKINYHFLSTLTGRKIYNYDLNNSQLNCMLSYSDIFGLKYESLKDYLQNNRRKEYANQIGIDQDILKGFLIRVVFGARLDLHKSIPNSLKDLYLEYGFNDFDKQVELHNKIQSHKGISLLLKDLLKWGEDCRSIIKETHAGSQGLPDWYDNGVVMIHSQDLTRYKEISSFLLQGMESSFICKLIEGQYHRIIGNDYGVISYEFDGIVTLGPVTEESISKARVLSGFKYAQLEIKPWIGKWRKFEEEKLFAQILREED